jgi:hypothetical protein
MNFADISPLRICREKFSSDLIEQRQMEVLQQMELEHQRIKQRRQML